MLEILYIRDIKVKAEYGDGRYSYGIIWRDVMEMSKAKDKQYYRYFVMYNEELDVWHDEHLNKEEVEKFKDDKTKLFTKKPVTIKMNDLRKKVAAGLWEPISHDPKDLPAPGYPKDMEMLRRCYAHVKDMEKLSNTEVIGRDNKLARHA